MRHIFIRTPWWLKKLYPGRIWDRDTKEKIIYLTFDDGPERGVTPFVLDELKKYNAGATFFCIGENARENPDLLRRIISEGHVVGNHTMHHPNGWKTRDEQYLSDIAEASAYIQSDWFRPPYGKMRSSQVKKLKKQHPAMRIVMWDVLSWDFDESCTAETCLKYVLKYTRSGSIVVFHDSIKAGAKLKLVLPEVLRFFAEKGYSFNAL